MRVFFLYRVCTHRRFLIFGNKRFLCLCWFIFPCCISFSFFYVRYIFCCILSVLFLSLIPLYIVLKSFHSLRELLLPYIWQILGQTWSNNFSWSYFLGLISYNFIFLHLFWNYLIVSKLNCLLILLPILTLVILHKWYCPIIY